MTLRMVKANSVAVGAFNMYIVQPNWLSMQKVIPEGSEIVFESDLERAGFRFSSSNFGTVWTVSPERLIIESKDPKDNCGELMAKVLEKLPFTPLKALGNNFVFEGGSSILGAMGDFGGYPMIDAPRAYKLQRRSYGFSLRKGRCDYNISFSFDHENVRISINANADTKQEDPQFAREHAKDFTKHRRVSKNLIRRIFKAEVSK